MHGAGKCGVASAMFNIHDMILLLSYHYVAFNSCATYFRLRYGSGYNNYYSIEVVCKIIPCLQIKDLNQLHINYNVIFSNVVYSIMLSNQLPLVVG